MKDMLTEIKNKFVNKNSQGINTRVNEAKHRINDLEHKKEKHIQSLQQEEKKIQKIEYSLSSLWDNFKLSNIHIIGVP